MRPTWKMPGRPPRDSVRRALFISLVLHGLLVIGLSLSGQHPRSEPLHLDTRVRETTYRLSLDDSPRSTRRDQDVGEEEGPPGVFPVRVESTPAVLAPGGIAQGPTLDIRRMPVAGQPAGRKGGGKAPGRSGFFGVPVREQSVVFVIDRSLSMGPRLTLPPALPLARAEVQLSLEALPPEAMFQVIFYNRAADLLNLGQPGLLPADPAVLQRVAPLIEAVRAEGGTDHEKALRLGLSLRPALLFLVTDADGLTDEQVRAITRFNAGRTVLHTVDVGVQANPGCPLGQLARANRGSYFWRGR